MDADSLKKKSIRLDKLLSCYLYISMSDSLLEDTIDNIKSFLKDKINFDTDFKIFSGMEEIDDGEFAGYINTPSLFSQKKVVVIKYIDKTPAMLQKKLAAMIGESGVKNGNIIFIITALKQKLNPALLETIRKKGKVIQLKPPLKGGLEKWLDEKSKLDGIRFTGRAKELFIENVNMDLNLLKREYEKLYDYISSETKKIIDEKIISSLVNRVYSVKIFDLVDFIGQRDKDNSLKALGALLEEEQNLIGLVTLIHRMFKCFLYVKTGNNRASVTYYIESNLKVSPYFVSRMVNKYIKFSDNYTEPEILEIFDILNKYDISFRTGAAESKNLIKKLIPEILNVRA